MKTNMNYNTYTDQAGSQIPLAFVSIEGMIVDMQLGVLPKEIGRVQRITIDVEVGFPDSMTEIADNEKSLIANGFDSRPVRELVLAACTDKTALMETIANKACHSLLSLKGALTVSIKITKNYLMPDSAKTSLTVHRKK